ncbi:EF-hand domain-containing protein [Marinoscillum sp.]|uniref:EF-hand domain-containing protein n=1 Tax=Marinoscillum sp. TaxID=2024838 RepID=UPI003BAB49C2
MNTPDDVRRKKLSYLFDILDSNKNQLLQPDDFVEVAEKMCDTLNYSESDKDRLQLRLKALRIYVQLLTDMGKSDVSINREEWCQFFTTDSDSETSTARRYIFRTAAYIFHLFDQNSDHVISREEYLDMFRIYQIDLSYSEIGFEKLDSNKDGKISLKEMVSGFQDFLLSADPEAAGNWIFGDWENTSTAHTS